MQLPDILRELGIDFRRAGESPHVTQGWVGLVCPYCGGGTGKYGFGVHLGSGRASCWKCGGSSLAEALAEASGQPIHRVRALLGDLERAPVSAPVRGSLHLPPAGDLLPFQRDYLRGRGFDPDELARLWGLRGIGLAPRVAWRILIPVADAQGQTRSWTTRAAADNTEVRYLSARPHEETTRAKSLLYGAHLLRGLVAVVVEGPTDAWRIGPGAVATLGVGYSRAQVRALTQLAVRAICFDAEAEAQRRAARLCDELACFPGKTCRVVLDASDPGSAPVTEIKKLRKMFLD